MQTISQHEFNLPKNVIGIKKLSHPPKSTPYVLGKFVQTSYLLESRRSVCLQAAKRSSSGAAKLVTNFLEMVMEGEARTSELEHVSTFNSF